MSDQTSEQDVEKMFATPQKEHEFLERLVGEWKMESEATMGPDQPPQRFSGTESVRTIGGLWAICEGEAEMPGGGMGKTVITLGYDPAKGRYVGTFIGSMMTSLWIYEGVMDESATKIVMATQGPNMLDPTQLSNYRDTFAILSDDHRTLTSESQDENGEWHQFMTAHYHRTK